MRLFMQKEDEMKAFFSSSLFLIAMLVGAAAGLYPTVLPSSTDPSRDLTIREPLSGLYALRVWVDVVVFRNIASSSVFRNHTPDVPGQGVW
jgi:cytochrome d ubiquinol oxidase subunit II